ncbi:MAG: DsbA family oxidoreductase [Pseudomonadota bacterium]
MSAHEKASPARQRLLVDIVSDPVCPWCYVGLKAFQHARDKISQDYQVLPRIRAYMLNPNTPPGGMDRLAHYDKKFPDTSQREQMALSIKAAAAGAGFQFDPMGPKWLPNTAKAHQLIRLAHYDGAQERLAEELYSRYWNDGDDIGDEAVLLTIAETAGLDVENAQRDFANPKSKNEILAEAEAFRQAGVTGVPTYIVNERVGFSGALPPVRLAEALRDGARQTLEN